jgi:hypothetical protein
VIPLNQKQKHQAKGKAKKALALAVAVVILGGVGAFLALNRGGSAAYTPVERFPDIHGLAVDPNDPKVLYVATHHGLIRGVEGDGTWRWFLVGNYRADFMGFSMHPNGKTFYASGHKVPDALSLGSRALTTAASRGGSSRCAAKSTFTRWPSAALTPGSYTLGTMAISVSTRAPMRAEAGAIPRPKG